MIGAIRPLPQYVFMLWSLVKHEDNFTFALPFGSRRSAFIWECELPRSYLCEPPRSPV